MESGKLISPMRNAHGISRRILSGSAWVLLMAVVGGYASLIPAVDTWMDSASGLTALGGRALLAVVGIAALGAWVSALIHAATTPPSMLVTPRWLLLGTLAVLSFAGAFFYYFLYVHWSAEDREQRYARQPFTAPDAGLG